ncbi:MAG: pyrimidine 5'-nucleotidase, partial [Rubrivivax sp.]|nr:pyrimidine 5'-nucleotidase [Rubrivivax sp.]
MSRPAGAPARPLVWLFDLDDTLHDASTATMPQLRESFGQYIQQHLQLSREESDALRSRYWQRYGATLLGLVRHHGVQAAHFLHHTHLLPGLEQRVRGHRHDLAALARLSRLPGRRYILTNAPAAYAARVLDVLGIAHLFDGLVSIEDMHMFGQLRPKPDARMLRRLVARLRVAPSQCVLVEDTLVHQKAAHGLGMKTVWMQRWLPGRPWRHAGRPGYVTRRVRTLARLHALVERTAPPA